jgi:hypothetical protein
MMIRSRWQSQKYKALARHLPLAVRIRQCTCMVLCFSEMHRFGAYWLGVGPGGWAGLSLAKAKIVTKFGCKMTAAAELPTCIALWQGLHPAKCMSTWLMPYGTMTCSLRIEWHGSC